MIGRDWLCQDCLMVTRVDGVSDVDRKCECGGALCWCDGCSTLARVAKEIGGRENTRARIELLKARGLGSYLRFVG